MILPIKKKINSLNQRIICERFGLTQYIGLRKEIKTVKKYIDMDRQTYAGQKVSRKQNS